jgi:hypothetical protein
MAQPYIFAENQRIRPPFPPSCDVAGRIFGDLVALQYRGAGVWLRMCRCGHHVIAELEAVEDGETRDCGCRVRAGNASAPGRTGQSVTHAGTRAAGARNLIELDLVQPGGVLAIPLIVMDTLSIEEDGIADVGEQQYPRARGRPSSSDGKSMCDNHHAPPCEERGPRGMSASPDLTISLPTIAQF